jgi:hypothetical protein
MEDLAENLKGSKLRKSEAGRLVNQKFLENIAKYDESSLDI